MVYLAAIALDATHDTVKSMKYYVLHSTSSVVERRHWNLAAPSTARTARLELRLAVELTADAAMISFAILIIFHQHYYYITILFDLHRLETIDLISIWPSPSDKFLQESRS